MKFNPTMLALSVANSGLITMVGYDSQSCGSIEHSFKAGSGEELRGIAVDKARAAAAYQKALKAIDDFKVKYAEVISEVESEVDEKIAKLNAESEERERKREQKRLEEKKKDARRDELKQKKKGFWGLTSEEAREYENLNSWVFDTDSIYDVDLNILGLKKILGLRSNRPSMGIEGCRSRIWDANAIAVTAQNSLYLSRDDVIEIYNIETDVDGWLSSKAGFACVLRHIHQKT